MTKWLSDGSFVVKEVPDSRSENHNTVSGSPIYSVQLEVPAANLKDIQRAILGLPEKWPHPTPLNNVYAIGSSVTSDKGEYNTDSDAQLAYVVNNYLVTFTYAPRTGIYTTVEGNYTAYVDDIIEPRNESHPLDPNKFIWGNTSDTVPNNTKRTLAASEAPVKQEGGETLTHTVEGWPAVTSDLDQALFTCNNAVYTSLVLKRIFDIGTLLLKSIQVTKGFTFASYRAPLSGPVDPGIIDYSGIAAPILKFIYEYKKTGWQRFYRYDADQTSFPAGYYYIRYANSPYPKFEPFPLTDHTDWL